jgi:hypothetical protein
MPRPGPRRPLVAIRLATDEIAWLDQRAEAEGLNRSEVVRRALAYARKHMPADWRP